MENIIKYFIITLALITIIINIKLIFILLIDGLLEIYDNIRELCNNYKIKKTKILTQKEFEVFKKNYNK